MRILLVSCDTEWSDSFQQLARVSGWSLRSVSSIEEFKEAFIDQAFDVIVAESMANADLVKILRQLRFQGSTCGVVWVNDEFVTQPESSNYGAFADYRVARRTSGDELSAILSAMLSVLQRYGWR